MINPYAYPSLPNARVALLALVADRAIFLQTGIHL
jgi:hypothetical protein